MGDPVVPHFNERMRFMQCNAGKGDCTYREKKRRAYCVHIPSSNWSVDPSHCLTTLTPSSVIIFGYLVRNTAAAICVTHTQM